MKNKFSFWGRFKNIFAHLGKHPSYDWYASLICFGILSLVAFGISGYMYYSLVMTPVKMSDTESAASSHLDRERVRTTLEKVQATEASAVSVSASVLADPS